MRQTDRECVSECPHILVDLQHHRGGVEVHVELVHQDKQSPDLLCHGVGHLCWTKKKGDALVNSVLHYLSTLM